MKRTIRSAFNRMNSRRRKLLRLGVESLESRRLMSNVPYGAQSGDTGEYMLGTVTVTPVLLESNGSVDPNTENWTTSAIDQVLSNLNEGLNWWKDLLATKTSASTLDFVVDTQFARTPVATAYEPINRVSNDYSKWTQEFLESVDFAETNNLEQNMRAFNHAQRLKHGTNWAFTVFIVNSQNDGDGSFALGGSFSRAFGFAGGLFFITPSTRPASTYAHETGHMFWARDEYAGSSNSSARRGYYNTQNLNAVDGNPDHQFVQAPSIMSSSTSLETAYNNLISPPSTLAMIGWQDSDGDGVFDVLDVPLSLDGVGRFDSTSGHYKFVGQAKVQTLPNRNSSGLRNDITINLVSRVEVRVNSGEWTVVAQPGTFEADLNLQIPLSGITTGTIEIRAVDAKTGITSNIFTGAISITPDATESSGIQGFAWYDDNRNSQIDGTDEALVGWTVQLIDSNSNLLTTQRTLEPDSQPNGVLAASAFPGVTLTSIGEDTDGKVNIGTDASASTGNKTLQPYSISSQGFSPTWYADRRQLRIDITNRTSFVSVDVIGSGVSSYGRLEIYDSAGNLLDRVTSDALSNGEVSTLALGRAFNDIAYAIVIGHMTTNIKIDNLKIGPAAQTKTDGAGRYELPYLPAGSYSVQLVAPNSNFVFTNTQGGQRSAQFGSGESSTHIDLGVDFTGSDWQNWRRALDVNNDGGVTALDVLLIINQINSAGTGALSAQGAPVRPYIDTSGDRSITALDALLVINEINARTAGGEGEPQTSPSSRGQGQGGTMGPEPEGWSPASRADGEGVRLVPRDSSASRTGSSTSPSSAGNSSIEQTPFADSRSREATLNSDATTSSASPWPLLDNASVLKKMKEGPQWELPIPCCCSACRAIDALAGD